MKELEPLQDVMLLLVINGGYMDIYPTLTIIDFELEINH